MLKKIVKRDGRTVDFNDNKIKLAIEKCYIENSIHITIPLPKIVNHVVKAVESRTSMPSVEDVQDCVEQTLQYYKEYDAAKKYILYREEHKINRGRTVPQAVKDAFAESEKYFPTTIQQFQFYDKYSRFNYEKGRRETWVETVDRSVDYLRELSENKLDDGMYQRIRNGILNMDVMPSMRLLAMAGDAARRNNICIYNCSYMPVDCINSFVEALIISMCGCGVGYSVERRYVNELPMVEIQDTTKQKDLMVVDDTSEGWADAVRNGLITWFSGRDIDFDYSQIRPSGSPLKVKGGRASGAEPLRKMLRFVRERILARQGYKLRTIDAHDIMCMVGSAAVSGGMRRTAMIALFDHDDKDMLDCKKGDFATHNPQRWNANNSAVWPDKRLTQSEIVEKFMDMHKSGNGEPGIFNRRSANLTIPKRREKYDFGTNPCIVGNTMVAVADGRGMVKIKDLADKGFDVEVLCVRDDGNVVTRSMRQPRLTGENKEILKITLADGGHVRCTPNHKFFIGKKEVSASELKNGDILNTIFTSNRMIGSCKYDQEIVLKVEKDGFDDVYNGTVDEYHNYFIGGFSRDVDEREGRCFVQVKNCGEISLRKRQFCNLSMAIARSGDNGVSLSKKVELATIIGTIQSMATHFPGLRPEWAMNCKEERLLGVDINGQMDCQFIKNPIVQFALQNVAIKTNAEYSKLLGIEQSKAITCVKPSGNSSILLDCSAGLHARWSKYYIRNVRVSSHSPLYKLLKKSGVKMNPENGQAPDNATTWVVSFPVKSPKGAVTRTDRTAIQQCNYWLSVKKNWTEHNPSVTITYREDEVIDIMKWLWENQDYIGGMTFYPAFDSNYEQMPYIEISEEKYNEMVESFPKIDFSNIYKFEERDLTTAAQEVACSSGLCEFGDWSPK